MPVPKLGDRIQHFEPSFDRVSEGEVTNLLAMQFRYINDNGYGRLCLYSEDWKVLKAAPREKKKIKFKRK